MFDKILRYVESVEKEAIPQLSVNCVILGFHEKALHVVVNRISLDSVHLMVLPGGYVYQKEDLVVAMERIVKESTGLEKILFKQFAVFGKASRSFNREFTKSRVFKSKADKGVLDWFSKRFVSVCYLALVDYSKIELRPTQFMDGAQWLPVNKLKELAMDHSDIVKSACESLRKEMPYTPIASNLLPSKFTLPELQALVESILGRQIDRPNFRRKILKTGMITKIGSDTSNKRRPADLYAFKHGRKTSLIEEYKFGF
jgi:8-oxo-dGTP diphosphatase